MEITVIEDWLKNTIPGIILLGAIGSILAAGILWLGGRLLLPLLRGYLGLLLKSVIRHFVSPAVKQLVLLHFYTAENKIQLFYTLQIMKTILALFISSCSFMMFLFSLSVADATLFRPSVIVPLIISFLGLWYSLRTVVIVMVPLHFDVEGQIEKVKAEILSNRES
ncbi:MAG TPA: hypothetical protein PLW86_14040, partial [Rhodocyclaceae bacterium]|nr:hypothetical protein [Rhodocyclaceae bacterium]